MREDERNSILDDLRIVKRLISAAGVLVLCSCAHTTIRGYDPVSRRPVFTASFQGDMTNPKLMYSKIGSTESLTFTADLVNHSTATKAEGDAVVSETVAAGGVLTAAGAAYATSGLSTLIHR